MGKKWPKNGEQNGIWGHFLFFRHFFLVDVSDIFIFLESGATGRGGVGFFIENPRRGGSPKEGGGEGREGVCEKIRGGGAKYFLGGRNVHQVFDWVKLIETD